MKLHLPIVLSLAFAASARADVITEWNALMRQTFVDEGSTATPPCNSRTMGMLGGSMYDAVNSINRNYSSYLGYFDPATAGSSTDTTAAAATAAYTVMTSIYTDLYGAGNPYLDNFTTLYNTQMASVAVGDARTRGYEVGLAAGQAMINARLNDGKDAVSSYAPQPVGTVGHWQPGTTPGAWGSGSGSFVKPQWSEMTPFAMTSSSQFRPAGPNGYQPSDYTSWVQSAAYTAEFNMVKDLGGTNSTLRTAEQTAIAYFWVDGPGTASPPGHWNRIAESISASMGLSVEENARLFALLNIAEADAGIASWDAKVFFDTWRPMLAINTASTDGNPDTVEDALWTPLIPNPSFGAYSSGHSGFSMTGATILANFFGTDDIAFTTDSESPFLPAGYTRSFSSFSEAAREAGMSRIYGGIHWMSDNLDGAILGANVANNTYSTMFLPVPEPGSAMLILLSGLAALRRRRA
ncbi:vanadium-dependent haloperoxidase [Prosthecobacter sp.]|uniref:vanadium-dependent haloperoxidase n=1 Tax=Prosthecobacter sp. TaxID=1965333 RepID=UPI001D85654C|nr:vanadium-dependent haloperoxidase [Prosthecobacter sp.]MCB1277720.1 phosphatase PAP2 family protein [Prosthecobacter sp.]